MWAAVTSLSPLTSLPLESLVLGRPWRDEEVMLERLVSQHPPDRVVADKIPRKALISHLESVLAQSPGSGCVTFRLLVCNWGREHLPGLL